MSPVEIIGFVFGVAGVWLTIKENIWCFPVGIINVLITAYLVFNKALFADTLQQIVYFILLVAGWIKWSRGNDTSIFKVSVIEKKCYLSLSIILIAGSLAMGYILKNFSKATFPFWDSAATVICFIAQWLIAKRKIENWLLWIIANPIYIIIYYLKEMPFYSILSIIYFLMAIRGWYQWKKSYVKQSNAL
ncbi:MAG: nicotinamide riboside transporter PnuC [Bacteroidia bacterium]